MQQYLSNLKIGQSGFISEILIQDIDKKRHLLELGLTKGTKVKVKKTAPYGGSISINLRGYELCISKKDAKNIIVLLV